MKLTARDQEQQNALAHAYHDRERFTLTGAGLQAEFVAEVLNRVPCVFGYGRYETNLELVQVTEAITNAAWNGEGLPPVGTVCEAGTCHHMDMRGEIEETPDTWDTVIILAHGIASGIPVAFAQGENAVTIGQSADFRQIRTTEQLSAEQREKVV